MSRNRYDRKPSRREEAEDRQRHYDNLTINQRIAQAKSRPGNSAREIARLEASKEAGLA